MPTNSQKIPVFGSDWEPELLTFQCKQNLEVKLALFDKINALIKMSKVEGPTNTLMFFGI